MNSSSVELSLTGFPSNLLFSEGMASWVLGRMGWEYLSSWFSSLGQDLTVLGDLWSLLVQCKVRTNQLWWQCLYSEKGISEECALNLKHIETK